MIFKKEALILNESGENLDFEQIDASLQAEINRLSQKRFFYNILNICSKIDNVIKNSSNLDFLQNISLCFYPTRGKFSWNTNVKLSSAINFGFVNKSGNIVPSSISKDLTSILNIFYKNSFFCPDALGNIIDCKDNEGILAPVCNVKDKLLAALVNERILNEWAALKLENELPINELKIKTKNKV